MSSQESSLAISQALNVTFREMAIDVATVIDQPGFVSVFDMTVLTLVLTSDSESLIRPVSELICVGSIGCVRPAMGFAVPLIFV